MANGDRAAAPAWLGWLLALVQALLFLILAWLRADIESLKTDIEADRANVAYESRVNAQWRGGVDENLREVREDVKDIRDYYVRKGVVR